MNTKHNALRFCPHCGQGLETMQHQRCMQCDAEMHQDWLFCAGCGAERGVQQGEKETITRTVLDTVSILALLPADTVARFREKMKTSGLKAQSLISTVLDRYIERGSPRLFEYKQGHRSITLNLSRATYALMQREARRSDLSMRGFARALIAWAAEEGVI